MVPALHRLAHPPTPPPRPALQRVEAEAGLHCCIVYGSLPAETRRQQARLFNDPASPYKVLIASDAIGLGLNFSIRCGGGGSVWGGGGSCVAG